MRPIKLLVARSICFVGKVLGFTSDLLFAAARRTSSYGMTLYIKHGTQDEILKFFNPIIEPLGLMLKHELGSYEPPTSTPRDLN